MNYLLNKIRKYIYFFISFFWSLYYKIVFKIKRITQGKGNQYFGYSTFYKTSGSVITIGKDCIFNSLPSWNLIGIQRRCIVATLTSSANIIIGNNCGFSGVTIGAFDSITIGDECIVGANVTVTDSDWHCLDCNMRHTGAVKTAPVTIEDNVFIGANTMILKGVRIGKNSIIGAGSIVSKDIPANCMAAGNPCKVIKQI